MSLGRTTCDRPAVRAPRGRGGRLSEILNRAGLLKERIILTRYGKGLAAVVPIEDLEGIEMIEDGLDHEHSRTAAVEAEQEGSRSWHEAKAELGL